MKTKQKPKGPWINRFVTRLFTVVLAVLIFWFLGFLVQDIKSIKGPQYDAITKRHVDQSLVKRRGTLGKQIADLNRKIGNRKEEQRIVGDSSQNLQRTINQLIELQKLSIQKDITLSESEQKNLAVSLSHFLESQKEYQELNTNISQLMAEKRGMQDEKRSVDYQLDQQHKPAREEYNRLNKRHRLKLAGLQLVILLPLLVAGAILIIKKRVSIYFPLFLAFGSATLVKVTLVMHEYFPKRYFKYIVIAVLILAVARLLIYFIRVVAFPKARWLTKQYREAYERFLCPVCEYPIRTGPRKFLFWTRRTASKIVLPKEVPKEEPYSCPACGTALFEECTECHNIRHTLLPHCQRCNAEKRIEE
jgi:Ca2+/Na+ antiporter